MNQNLPLVFIHRGYSDYMEYSLHQAKAILPSNTEIILLGDSSNDRFDFVTHVDMNAYHAEAQKFLKIYRHHSTNNYRYESFCIIRWFLLYRYMHDNHLDACFVIDTDAMLYDYPLELFKYITSNYDFSGIESYTGERSAGQGIWKQDKLKEFCDFIYEFYNSDLAFKQAVQRFRGLSDMTLFFLFLEQHPEDKFFNITSVQNHLTTDEGMLTSNSNLFKNDYSMNPPLYFRKKIIWRQGMPYGFRKKSNEEVRFYLLHFQGVSKYAMAKFYKGLSFKTKRKLDLKFFFANIAATIYGKFISPIRYRCKLFLLKKYPLHEN